MTINDILAAIKPTFLQGTLAGQEYPAGTFFTFWNFDSSEEYYSNKPSKLIRSYWVYCYSEDPEELEINLNAAITALRSSGYIVEPATDAASDEPTYTGKMITVISMETLEV